LKPATFVERLLDSEEPVWHRWDRDVPALIQALIDAASNERDQAPVEDQRIRSLMLRRIFWLLDRLLPKSEGAVFEPFLSFGPAVFAWGRRLSAEQRGQLPADSDEWWRMAAWCDSCPDDQLPSLLEWIEDWKPFLKTSLVPSQYPEDEFYGRCSDGHAAFQALCGQLATAGAIFRHEKDPRALARESIDRCLKWTSKHAAQLLPDQ